MEKRIAIFDDNDNRREGLEMLFSITKDMVCVGSFTNCSTVEEDLMHCQPDVVLMDIDMPLVNGIEGVKRIRNSNNEVKILMQTVFEDDDKIFDSICAGADGYILKKAQPKELIKAINEVLTGGAPMTPSIARQVLRFVNNQIPKKTPKDFKLTPQEIKILSLLVEGLSYKMIAAQCNISFSTVNTHVQHIFEKLQVHSVVSAVTVAIEHKITPPNGST